MRSATSDGMASARRRAETAHRTRTAAEAAVMAVLKPGDLRTREARRRIAAFGAKHGGAFYVELLLALTHLRFDERAAIHHWRRIGALQQQMESRLGTSVDVRIALVNYFLAVSRKLKNPTIIELTLYQKTQASVYRDELTGLYNHRYLQEHLVREIDRVERSHVPMSLLMLDLDDFKRFNDQYGHQSGNRLLVRIGHILRASVRKVDVAARYGGEEFVVVLSETSKDKALLVAERIRRAVQSHSRSRSLAGITVSIGIAALPIDGATPDTLIEAADAAMYLAKSRGKNRVVFAGEDRRSYSRAAVAVKGAYRALSADYRSFVSLDVSEGGVSFETAERVPSRALVDLKLRLPSLARGVRCIGRVVRVRRHGERYVVAVSFLKISVLGHRGLARFVDAKRGVLEASVRP
jgi:diguanylate cyclase (GGDEF)-like protein